MCWQSWQHWQYIPPLAGLQYHLLLCVVSHSVGICYRTITRYLLPYNHTLISSWQWQTIPSFVIVWCVSFRWQWWAMITLYQFIYNCRWCYLIQHSGPITLQRMVLLHICVMVGGVVCMAVITPLKYIYSPLSFGGGVGVVGHGRIYLHCVVLVWLVMA